jgi:hypothetical protein
MELDLSLLPKYSHNGIYFFKFYNIFEKEGFSAWFDLK